MDVDWLKTGQGRDAAIAARAANVSVPSLFFERGLRHVRLRTMEYDLFNARPASQHLTLLDEMEQAVAECLRAGLVPIVAFQAERFKNDPTNDTELEAVVEWWAAVALRLSAYDYRLAYNIVIETTGAVKLHNDRLNLLYKQAEARLHEIDPRRILIVCPNRISDPHELVNLVVPASALVMVEWHFYAAGPQKDNRNKQWTNGTEHEKSLILDSVWTASNWSQSTGIPTWVGAWMANNYNKGDDTTADSGDSSAAPSGGDYTIAEQVHFATFMSQTLQQHAIPYAVNSDTKFFNRVANVWYNETAPVLHAMLQDYTGKGNGAIDTGSSGAIGTGSSGATGAGSTGSANTSQGVEAAATATIGGSDDSAGHTACNAAKTAAAALMTAAVALL